MTIPYLKAIIKNKTTTIKRKQIDMPGLFWVHQPCTNSISDIG